MDVFEPALSAERRGRDSNPQSDKIRITGFQDRPGNQLRHHGMRTYGGIRTRTVRHLGPAPLPVGLHRLIWMRETGFEPAGNEV